MQNQQTRTNIFSYVDPSKIYEPLYCTICFEVFSEPICLGCMHTFCCDCIGGWIQKCIGKPECPTCRAAIKPNQITKDLLAFNLISELKVFCPNKQNGCEWSGERCHLDAHTSQQC